MAHQNLLVPVILSGGAGTRLWPVSREGHPKPFMTLADGESLLFKTYRRATKVMESDGLITVTNRDYYFHSKDELLSLKSGVNGIFLLEPFGRNTAPALAMAALEVSARFGPDAIMLILAADHLIQDQQKFEAAVKSAKALASQGFLVTFGIPPEGPDTGFGYIECAESLGSGFRVARFTEKPDLETAKALVASGKHLWNSGMFCMQAGLFLDELSLHAPEIMQAATICREPIKDSAAMYELHAESFGKFPDISIDYAVMERSNRVAVVPGDFGWSDIGSWHAMKSLTPPDEANNRIEGDNIIVIDSHNLFVRSEDRLVAALGVDDLVVIDTPDALLIVHADKTQDIRKVVAQLKAQGHECFKLHRTVHRPWGTYTVLEEGPRFKIKRIEVKPGASLSLQMHHHRSEHWVVVRGTALVTNGETEHLVCANESTYIPAGNKHRLKNPGVIDLVMIEVQSGEYLGEDDIVRFQDAYGRS